VVNKTGFGAKIATNKFRVTILAEIKHIILPQTNSLIVFANFIWRHFGEERNPMGVE
jgi:hypothetical protein